MISFGIGVSLSVRLGHTLPHNVLRAKYLVWGTMIISCTIFLLASVALYYYRSSVYRIFTNDQDFLDLFDEARWPFTFTLVLMNLSVAIERIPYSMGRTKEVFWNGFIASWGAQVPAVLVFTRYWRDDLVGHRQRCVLKSGLANLHPWRRIRGVRQC